MRDKLTKQVDVAVADFTRNILKLATANDIDFDAVKPSTKKKEIFKTLEINNKAATDLLNKNGSR